MLLYCGITMVRPMSEIAKLFEKREGVRISIAQGGSEDLYQSIAKGSPGDWYLPGEPSYAQGPERQQFFQDRTQVGFNRMALIVAKGNPKQVKPALQELLRRDLTATIGNSESGSVGKEARRMLEQAKLYTQVVRQVSYLAPDSRSITNALKRGEADVALNWRATAFFGDNLESLQVIDLPAAIAKPQPLILLSLRSSRNPDMAAKFLKFTASHEGQAIFKKHGFLETGPQ